MRPRRRLHVPLGVFGSAGKRITHRNQRDRSRATTGCLASEFSLKVYPLPPRQPATVREHHKAEKRHTLGHRARVGAGVNSQLQSRPCCSCQAARRCETARAWSRMRVPRGQPSLREPVVGRLAYHSIRASKALDDPLLSCPGIRVSGGVPQDRGRISNRFLPRMRYTSKSRRSMVRIRWVSSSSASVTRVASAKSIGRSA